MYLLLINLLYKCVFLNLPLQICLEPVQIFYLYIFNNILVSFVDIYHSVVNIYLYLYLYSHILGFSLYGVFVILCFYGFLYVFCCLCIGIFYDSKLCLHSLNKSKDFFLHCQVCYETSHCIFKILDRKWKDYLYFKCLFCHLFCSLFYIVAATDFFCTSKTTDKCVLFKMKESLSFYADILDYFIFLGQKRGGGPFIRFACWSLEGSVII